MNRKVTEKHRRYSDPTKRTLLVGYHRRRIDPDRRVRLPAFWAPDKTQTWLLFPPHLFSPGKAEGKDLGLFPTGGASLNAKIPASVDCATSVSTFKALLEILQGNAKRLSLPPDLATAVRINPAFGRFTLTEAQIDWLGGRGRTVVLAGVLTHARIRTPTVWCKWRREVVRRLAELDAPKRLQG